MRKIGIVALVVALAGLVVSPVEAKKRKKAVPVQVTYYMNWFGDCAGSGVLGLETVPNPDACALYFPGLGDSFSFPGSEGFPFALDVSKPITVDFSLSTVVTVAADFEVVLEGTIGDEDKVIASGTQTVLAATNANPPAVHYDLEPDAALDKAQITHLTLTISWTNGATYSTIDFDAAPNLVINGFK